MFCLILKFLWFNLPDIFSIWQNQADDTSKHTTQLRTSRCGHARIIQLFVKQPVSNSCKRVTKLGAVGVCSVFCCGLFLVWFSSSVCRDSQRYYLKTPTLSFSEPKKSQKFIFGFQSMLWQ